MLTVYWKYTQRVTAAQRKDRQRGRERESERLTFLGRAATGITGKIAFQQGFDLDVG